MSYLEKESKEEHTCEEKKEAVVLGKKMSDAEELREVLKAISDFLRDLQEPVKNILVLFQGSLSGDKLGEDVANFYKRLKESGLKEEQVEALTREYFEHRMVFPKLMKELVSMISERKLSIEAKRRKSVEKS